jgi:hypothetical protein
MTTWTTPQQIGHVSGLLNLSTPQRAKLWQHAGLGDMTHHPAKIYRAARKQAEALRLRRPDMAPDELARHLRCVGWMAIARDVLGLEP